MAILLLLLLYVPESPERRRREYSARQTWSCVVPATRDDVVVDKYTDAVITRDRGRGSGPVESVCSGRRRRVVNE